MEDTFTRLESALDGRYRIEREIGRGGMATVYLADDLKHRRHVAVKVLHSDVASTIGPDRFLREVDVVACLNHPRILPLHDSGNANGFLFFVMPYVKGESLRARMLREGQLAIDESLTITRQVATALAYAHAQHVIHRDVKPENIMLHEGEAMVADFGIALVLGQDNSGRITEGGFAVGTPAYMSPEQSLGESTVDARSDVYSLACVLYEMLAGEPPYTAPNSQALLVKRLIDPIPSVRRVRGAVPTNVDQALTKALAKTPADRFLSVSAFADALSAPAPPKPAAVAVLPFLNLSTDPENEYFADGITEDVIAHLSKVRALTVISRTSVMPFKKSAESLKQIGAKLGATTLVEGSVRRSGDRVRIVAQLIDADADRNLWSDTYDRKLTDIFDIQTDVALQIASALEAELTVDEHARLRKEPTSNVEAYKLYLQGRHWYVKYTTAGMHEAISYFERAIALDPNYSMAYANMAIAYTEIAEIGAVPPSEAFPKARAAATTALDLDPTLAEAHSTAAYLKMCDFDWAGAERGFKRALELNPNSADTYDLYGRLCSAQRRFDEAIALLRRAQAMDPLAHRLECHDHAVARGALHRGCDRRGERTRIRARAGSRPRHTRLGAHQEGQLRTGTRLARARGVAIARHHAVDRAARTRVRTGGARGESARDSKTPRGGGGARLRVAVPARVRVHRRRRLRSRARSARARRAGARGRSVRDQRLVPARTAAIPPTLPGAAQDDESGLSSQITCPCCPRCR